VQLTAKQLLAKKQLPDRAFQPYHTRHLHKISWAVVEAAKKMRKQLQQLSHTHHHQQQDPQARPHTLRHAKLPPAVKLSKHQLLVCVCVYVNVCVSCVCVCVLCVCEVWKAVALNPVCLAGTFSRGWQQPGAVARHTPPWHARATAATTTTNQLCPSLLILFV